MIIRVIYLDYTSWHHSLTGVLSLAARIVKAHLIAKVVKLENPPRSSRDHFNAFGLGITHVVRSVYTLMARPVGGILMIGSDEPFYLLKSRGGGPNGRERVAFLLAIITVAPLN